MKATSNSDAAIGACPRCHESEQLRGRRQDDVIQITCGACGHVWERDTKRRCHACGSTDLRYTPKPLWERGRGEQRTPAGRIDAYSCNDCGAPDAVRAIGGDR